MGYFPKKGLLSALSVTWKCMKGLNNYIGIWEIQKQKIMKCNGNIVDGKECVYPNLSQKFSQGSR